MKDEDVMQLDASERKVLDLSFQTGLTESRIRNIVINSSLAAVAVILSAVYGIPPVWLVALTVIILLIAALEKISYARALLHYRSLVRKLVYRVEQLEGAPATALGSHPAATLERRLDLDKPSTASGSPLPFRH